VGWGGGWGKGGGGGGVFAWLKSFARPDSSQPVLCGAAGTVCRLFLEDSQIISVITDCNTVDPWVIRTDRGRACLLNLNIHQLHKCI